MKRSLFLFLPVLLFGLAFGQRDPLPAALRQENLPNKLYFPVISNEISFLPRRLGPDYGRVLGIVQDAANKAQLYAGTFGSGIYRSFDGGSSWEPASLGISYLTIQSLAADPVTPNTLYAGTYGTDTAPYSGVFKSTNAGATWQPTGELANVWNGVRYNKPVVYALAVDPLNPNRVFAGTRMKFLPSGALGGGGVFRSDNGGATWKPINSGLPYEDLYIYDLAIDASHPGRVYAALHEHGLYRSDNNGDSWYHLSGTPYAGRAVAVDPFSTSTLYFGAVKKLGTHRSVDAGSSWSLIGGGWDNAVGALSPDPYRQGVLYAGVLVNNTSDVLYRSENHGGSWNAVGKLPTWGKMVFLPDGQQSLVGVDFDGPYRSTNAGLNWGRSAQGLSGFSVTGLGVHPAAPTTLFAGLYGFGFFYSNDTGASWQRSSYGLGNENILALAVDPANPTILYVTTDSSAVYRSTNGGAGWGALSGGYPAAAVPSALAEAGETPDTSPFANRPFPPRDDLLDDPEAAVLPALAAPTGRAAGRAIAVSPFNSSVVLVGTAGRGIYRLNGSTWAASSLTSGTVYSLLFDQAGAGRVLAAVSGGSGGVLASPDNGQTWQPSNTGLAGRTVYSLAQSTLNPAFLLAGTDAGVYKSHDSGRTWSSIGLPGSVVKAVGLLPARGGLLFAGTDSAAYYYDPGKGAWIALGKPLENVGIQGIVPDTTGQALYFTTRLAGTVRVDVY